MHPAITLNTMIIIYAFNNVSHAKKQKKNVKMKFFGNKTLTSIIGHHPTRWSNKNNIGCPKMLR